MHPAAVLLPYPGGVSYFKSSLSLVQNIYIVCPVVYRLGSVSALWEMVSQRLLVLNIVVTQ